MAALAELRAAIRSFNEETGGDSRFRDVRGTLRDVERDLDRLPSEPQATDEDESPGQRAAREQREERRAEREGDTRTDGERPKSFSDAKKRAAEKYAGDGETNDRARSEANSREGERRGDDSAQREDT